MSAINTNGINVNYPIPGVNNSSQGFRDNFANIVTNLNTAGTEITDLQNNVVVKQALANTVLNNDMANTLISNASVRSFRATTYNLGAALVGITKVDASLGDVQYGTVAANSNVILQFGNWSPAGTQQVINLNLSFNDSNSYVSFPSSVAVSNNNGSTTLENFSNVSNIVTVSAPYGVTEMDFRLSTLDCGNTVTVEPINVPRQTGQLQTRTYVSPVGFPGDVSGAINVGPSYNQLPLTSSNSSTDLFTTSGNNSQLYIDMPIVFTGVSMEANVTIGTTYYVTALSSNTAFSISSTVGGANIVFAGNATPSSAMYADPVSSIYVCTNSYNATPYQKSVSGTDSSGNITLSNTTSLAVNAPVVFTGNVVGGIVANTVYYVKSIGTGGNITISQSRTSGVAGTEVVLSTATPANSLYATTYVGSDIWKMLPLVSW
jgi:hypothetical protein